MARRLIFPARRRARSGLVLLIAVLVAHACVLGHIADTVGDWSAEAARPERLQVAYVRELTPTEAPAPVRAPPAPPPPAPERAERAPTPPMDAASAPAPADPAGSAVPDLPVAEARDASPNGAESPPDTALPPAPEEATRLADNPLPPEPAPSAPVAMAAVAAASAPADTPAFEWPASTRLSYRLTGQYRGEVNGSAQVEWVLAAPRYQVNLDVTVGLPIAPLFTRQMRSDGRLSAAGLHPERYDEISQLAFRGRRQATVQIGEGGVTLANGQRWTPPAADLAPSPQPRTAVQDSASQFVQLSYLFTLQPERLTPGRTIGFPLALPRRVEPWVYEVVGAQTLHTPFGPLDTFHVRPRRGTPRGNDLLAEAWFSPQLAYLPVRIRIEQDADTFIDLVIDRKPELAAR